MKQVFLSFLLAIFTLSSYSQNSWTWLKGASRTAKYGVYGTQGIADPANVPGFRTGEATWVDSVGNIWMFGGTGNARNTTGMLNDLWKFDKATATWTWINGYEGINSFGSYGTKGIPSSLNSIRSRANAATWIDKSGNFWIYGGQGYDNFTTNTPTIYLNDFWKFEPGTLKWTWMGGDTTSRFRIAYASVPGTKGTPSGITYPGSRFFASSWVDNDGDRLWLFGGREPSVTNGLWSYSISSGQWTWVSGDPSGNNSGSFGPKGTAAAGNQPPPRWSATSWQDLNGDLFIFGGSRSGSSPTQLNDVWKFSVSTGLWSWVAGENPASGSTAGNYGTIGTPSSDNSPAGRSSAIRWKDQSGNIWLYGGVSQSGYFNDIWKFVPSSNQWAWMQGPQGGATLPAIYGSNGMFSSANRPASTENFSAWIINNQFYLRSSNQNWQFDPALLQWAWLGGDTTSSADPIASAKSVYGVPTTFDPANQPKGRFRAETWTDSTGNLWLFGGSAGTRFTSNTPYYEFWKYSPALNQWAWIGGDSLTSKPSVYGDLGVPASTNFPATRAGAYTWTDKTGNLWMFSGVGNELWRYTVSTGLWTWMGGNASANNVSYGSRGVPAASNYPPAKTAGGVTWVDKAVENVWFFSGSVFDDQLWRYNMITNIWTWFGGATNPMATSQDRRIGAASWVDNSGQFWIFGGSNFVSADGENTNTNSLRKFDPITGAYTLVKGDESPRKKGIYGVKGVPASGNTPGARINAKSWSDGNGNLYLFGGSFDSISYLNSNMPGYFNDTWKYEIASNQWTWISGDSTLDHWGIYGTMGIPSNLNQPGGRDLPMSWSNGKGSAWLFSGFGFADNGLRTLNDMMRYDANVDAVLPVTFTSFTAAKKADGVELKWSTAQEFNTRSYFIERSGDGISFAQIGTVNASGNSNYTTSYSFNDYHPIAGLNLYRLKETDLDGKFMYSETKQVVFDGLKSAFRILGNPVKNKLSLSVDLPFAQSLVLRVSRATGQILIEKEYRLEKGNRVIDLNLLGVSEGIYTLSVFSESIKESKKFLKTSR